MKQVNQKIFNRAWHHMLCQEAKSERNGESRYYGPNGLRGPIGCLIDRDFYRPELEGQKPTSRAVLNAIAASMDVNPQDIDRFLIDDLAASHEDTPPRYWWSRLMRVATQAALDAPERPGFGDRIKHWFGRRLTHLWDVLDGYGE
jgi:hypothetical protein